MSLALFIEPHPHHSNRGRIVEKFVGLTPGGTGSFGFTVPSDHETIDTTVRALKPAVMYFPSPIERTTAPKTMPRLVATSLSGNVSAVVIGNCESPASP